MTSTQVFKSLELVVVEEAVWGEDGTVSDIKNDVDDDIIVNV